jgi:cytochrome c-type biogenesis protein CcmH
MISRRDWLSRAAVAAGAFVVSGRAYAQKQDPVPTDTSNLFPMDQGAARSVRLPAKSGATASMSNDDRDALEHRIRCQCGCTLDVFTCRTTDFSCQVSPAMHRDIMSLVAGGYSADEILKAFTNVYGDRALMAPPKVGFNILGYVLPSVAVAVGAVVLAVVIKRWNRGSAVAARAGGAPAPDATADEMARLEAAVRDDA